MLHRQPRVVHLRGMKVLTVSLTLVFLCACGSRTSEANKEPVKQYSLHGEVVRVDPQGKVATIKAQKIEGWMEAMTMEYPVKDAQDFSALHPNDCIDATLYVQGNEFWVAQVKPASAPPGMCVAADSGKAPSKAP